MTQTRHTRLLIVGSGPAGYSAAVYGARAMLEPVLVQGIQPGGQLTITTDVENWPGDTMVTGPELMVRMEAHAREMGTDIINEHIASLDLSVRPFRALGDTGAVYRPTRLCWQPARKRAGWACRQRSGSRAWGCRPAQPATGFSTVARKLSSSAAGNTAVEEALFLTNFATRVTLVHRRDSLRAEKILQHRLLNHPKVQVIWDHTLQEVLGDTDGAGVQGARLAHTATSATQELAATGSSSPSATARPVNWSRTS